MMQENIANRISMLLYWKSQKTNVTFYLRNYNYETIHARMILKCFKSPKTGVWYVLIKGQKSLLQYRIDDIILIRKLGPDFPTVELVKKGRRKMFQMRQRGRL